MDEAARKFEGDEAAYRARLADVAWNRICGNQMTHVRSAFMEALGEVVCNAYFTTANNAEICKRDNTFTLVEDGQEITGDLVGGETNEDGFGCIELKPARFQVTHQGAGGHRNQSTAWDLATHESELKLVHRISFTPNQQAWLAAGKIDLVAVMVHAYRIGLVAIIYVPKSVFEGCSANSDDNEGGGGSSGGGDSSSSSGERGRPRGDASGVCGDAEREREGESAPRVCDELSL